MAKYLVTGGAGFIGSHLVEALIALGHQVIVLDNLSNGSLENVPNEANFVEGSILDSKLLDELMQTVDACFHLAAIPSVTECTKNWTGTHQVNATGTVNILNAARPDKLGRQIPVIFASSCAVYGESPKTKLKETDKIIPISPYGADKLASELHAYVAFHQFNVPTVCLRIFNVYGTRQSPNSPYSGVISIFADRLKRRIPVTIFGDGKQSRDFIYVKDVVEFFIKASQLKHNSALVINACTGKSTTVNNLFKIMSEIVQQKVDVNYEPPRPGDVYHSRGDPTFARKRLNFQPKYSLRSGLSDFLTHEKL
jgi:UDP-glucose 4-epimerase